MAESLRQFSDYLDGRDDVDTAIYEIIKDTMKKHSRIIFNGNNYAEEWVIEAERRGLSNFKTAVDALPHYVDDKNVKLFERHNVYSKEELQSRRDILLEEYSKTINIEALTMIDMANKDIIPAVCSYIKSLTDTALNKKALSAEIDCTLEIDLVKKLTSLNTCLCKKINNLDSSLLESKNYTDVQENAEYYRDIIKSQMQEIRLVVDELETIVSKEFWPFPTYADLLFSF